MGKDESQAEWRERLEKIAQEGLDKFAEQHGLEMSPLTEAAHKTAEIVKSFEAAGFTTRQSLYLAMCASLGTPGTAPPG